jgi:protein-L-isoaspartate(D-aspartate) O-methyltransferase
MDSSSRSLARPPAEQARRPRKGRFKAPLSAIGLACALAGSAAAATGDDFKSQRQQMVSEIAAMARSTAREVGRDRFSDPVMQAMAKVPRHRFVPEHLEQSAYRNRPLPIGEGQTISQPYIVALSTDLIDPQPHHVVLEIGTGSGYQAAVLAEVVKRVYSIEIVEPLGREAASRLSAVGYRNVEVRIGDGYQGWPEKGPFDGIIVTAAAPNVPPPLVQQLKPGGRMIIPVGARGAEQELLLIEKAPDGAVATRTVLPVRFVPLTRENGNQRPRAR